jgi:guanylate kinase
MLKHIFLIDGASGTGKTDLVAYIAEKYQSGDVATVITKFTTRHRRRWESMKGTELDLEFVDKAEFKRRVANEPCFRYEYGGALYAFFKKALDQALDTYQCVFVIVRNGPLIRQLKKEYSSVHVVTVFLYSDEMYVQQRLMSDNYDGDAISFRLERHKHIAEDYYRETDLYDETLVNNSTRTDFQRLINGLIRKYTSPAPDTLPIAADQHFPLPKPLVGFRDAMLNAVLKFPYEKNVFLMMKFRNQNELVFNFIAEQLKLRGYNCVRSDKKEWAITSNVYNPIAVLHCCKYGIALFDQAESGSNFSPNVAYELGMMHLQRKHCLILRHESLPQMPFDLIKDLHIRYSNDLELKDIIINWLESLPRD